MYLDSFQYVDTPVSKKNESLIFEWREYNKMGQYFDQHSIILSLFHDILLYIYIYTWRIAVLIFLEIAVSRVPVFISPYLAYSIGAS
jgi:hypothetical protein